MCDLASRQVLEACDELGRAVDPSASGGLMSPDWSNKVGPVPYAMPGNPQTRLANPHSARKF